MDTARQELELAVRVKLRTLSSSSREHSKAVTKNVRMGLSQLAALVEIGRNPGIRVTDFALLRDIKLATASNLVDKLVERGWVRRKRRDQDQRNVRLFLTERGQQALERYPAPSQDIVTTALAMIPAEALAVLDRSLDSLITNVERIVTGDQPAPLGDT